mmetsp:Transcript_74988/g.242486  ORF Transcript_74988/g.242486 Transcript_74988/m.242486 type:complete len:247 (-) Transcript_74988:143-883(-)
MVRCGLVLHHREVGARMLPGFPAARRVGSAEDDVDGRSRASLTLQCQCDCTTADVHPSGSHSGPQPFGNCKSFVARDRAVRQGHPHVKVAGASHCSKARCAGLARALAGHSGGTAKDVLSSALDGGGQRCRQLNLGCHSLVQLIHEARVAQHAIEHGHGLSHSLPGWSRSLRASAGPVQVDLCLWRAVVQAVAGAPEVVAGATAPLRRPPPGEALATEVACREGARRVATQERGRDVQCHPSEGSS